MNPFECIDFNPKNPCLEKVATWESMEAHVLSSWCIAEVYVYIYI